MLEAVVGERCQGLLTRDRREVAVSRLSSDVRVEDQVAERILLASYIEAAPER
jgi:hypothetical protein